MPRCRFACFLTACGCPDETSQLALFGESLRSTAVKSGYLMKSGHHKKTWHRRWFVLSPTGVGYFESDAAPVPLGVLLPSEIVGVIWDVSAELDLPFAFRIMTSHRPYDMQASNSRDQSRWVTAFQHLASAASPASS
jgi:PH domain